MIHLLLGFSGRLRRLPYLGGLVLAMLVVAPIQVLGLLLHTRFRLASDVLATAASLLGWWSFLAVIVKRLHDMDRSGAVLGWYFGALALGGGAIVGLSLVVGDTPWLGLPLAILVIGNFAFNMWLLFTRGTPGPNRFDRDPPGWGAGGLRDRMADAGV